LSTDKIDIVLNTSSAPGNDALDRRRAVGLMAGGVIVVTAADSLGRPRGMTTTAVSAISFEPLRVIVSMARASRTRRAVEESQAFALNVLAADQQPLAELFASKSDEKFAAAPWGTASAGSPVLEHGVLTWVECAVEQELLIDGHSIFVGRVTDGRGEVEWGSPLVHFDRRYGSWSEQ
jgi:flavin reductase (DIM6/NTAB) family NADH-FMN oxidoreductase RutF